MKDFARLVENFVLGEVVSDVGIGVATARKQFEGFDHKLGSLFIHQNGFSLWIIEIAKGRFVWPFTPSEFLAIPSFDVFREVIDIILGLAKGDGQHEFPLGGILKPKRGKFEIKEFSCIQKIDDSSSINGIAGEAVSVPGQNPICFTRFYLLDDFIEFCPPWFFGGFGFGNPFHHSQIFSFGKFFEFSHLSFNRENLSIRFISTFSTVSNIFEHKIFYSIYLHLVSAFFAFFFYFILIHF